MLRAIIAASLLLAAGCCRTAPALGPSTAGLSMRSFGAAQPAMATWFVDDIGICHPEKLVLRAKRIGADRATLDLEHTPDGFDHNELHVELERVASEWRVRDCVVVQTDSGDRYELRAHELRGSLAHNGDVDAANGVQGSFRLYGETARGATVLAGACFARF
jgi:hypothetical protein